MGGRIHARYFEIMIEDLRILLRAFVGRKGQPAGMILDDRALQSMPESGVRGGLDGAKRRDGSMVQATRDTQGHRLALHVTVTDQQEDRNSAANGLQTVR